MFTTSIHSGPRKADVEKTLHDNHISAVVYYPFLFICSSLYLSRLPEGDLPEAEAAAREVLSIPYIRNLNQKTSGLLQSDSKSTAEIVRLPLLFYQKKLTCFQLSGPQFVDLLESFGVSIEFLGYQPECIAFFHLYLAPDAPLP